MVNNTYAAGNSEAQV